MLEWKEANPLPERCISGMKQLTKQRSSEWKQKMTLIVIIAAAIMP